MRRFGLIGKTLSHSFSKSYFEEKFRALGIDDCTFSNFEMAYVADLRALVEKEKDLAGLNVTVPYKESVIRFLDEVDAEAGRIGAVNCIRIEKGRLTGYNTDAYGFRQSIQPFIGGHQRALVLGTGGSARAVSYVLRGLGLDVLFASRSEKAAPDVLPYAALNEVALRACTCVVNCTPLGMHPHTQGAPPIPYEHFTPHHLAFDLVYNPPETVFLRMAKERGAVAVNGLSMLKLQAEKSWEIWNRN